MLLTAAAVLALAARCAPQAAPQTLLAVARAESGLDPFAIRANGGPAAPRADSAAAAAAAVAPRLAQGASLDLGLMQINSRNLARLGLTASDAFDPCRSLAAAARLLAAGYRGARARGGEPQAALRTALSVYNTGDAARGLRNGYVARVEATAGVRQSPAPSASSPWAAFAAAAASPFVISPSPSPEGVLP